MLTSSTKSEEDPLELRDSHGKLYGPVCTAFFVYLMTNVESDGVPYRAGSRDRLVALSLRFRFSETTETMRKCNSYGY